MILTFSNINHVHYSKSVSRTVIIDDINLPLKLNNHSVL